MLEKMYLSENRLWLEKLQDSRLVLPFFDLHSIARKYVLAEVSKGSSYWTGGNSGLFVVGAFSEDGLDLTISCLMCAEPYLLSWQTIVNELETFAKRHACQRIVLTLTKLTEAKGTELINCGFHQAHTSNHMVKKLCYHSALVLGGGGAHGAYQIGVCQAIEELKLPIAIVAGTSVGALNGALFVQGSIVEAEGLWHTLTTQHVLSFPYASGEAETFSRLIHQIGLLTQAAIHQRGISRQPLRQLMTGLLQSEKMRNSTIDFYFVTTELTGLKEEVVHGTEVLANMVEWLLASSAFFPAMEYITIDGKSYIDGGYRNNIPIDAALKAGATEGWFVDIKGPGITKKTTIPVQQPFYGITTPWSLGNFLLFDPARSKTNIRLGYLDTLKSFGRLSGWWYSFSDQAIGQQTWKKFMKKVMLEQLIPKKWLLSQRLQKKVRKLYKDRVAYECYGQVFLELTAKFLLVDPTIIYSEETIKQAIFEQSQRPRTNGEPAIRSVQEWLEMYREEYFLLSDTRQLQLISAWLADNVGQQSQAVLKLWKYVPVQLLLALFLEFIREELTCRKNLATKL